MEEKRYTFTELREVFNKINDYIDDGILSKQVIKAVVVFTEDSFDKQYSLEERSYVFNSDNKMFHNWMIGTSLYGNSLDGKDCGVRLDYYLGDWKVDYCYLLKEN